MSQKLDGIHHGLTGIADAAPAAGTTISNIAYVTYTVPAVAATPGLGGLGTPASTVTNQPSNTVVAVVQQVAAFTLTSAQTRLAPLGATIYFFDPSGNRNEVFTGGYVHYPDTPTLTWDTSALGAAAFSQDNTPRESFFTVLT